MSIIVFRMQLEPFHGLLAYAGGEQIFVSVFGAYDTGPFTGRTFNGVVGRRHGRRHCVAITGVPAPMRQSMGGRWNTAIDEILLADATCLRPFDPVVGVVLLDANITNEIFTGHIVSFVAAVLQLKEVHGHILGELLDYGKHTH